MKKENVLMIIMPLLLLILVILGLLNVNNINDAIKFKNEYEALNGEYYEISVPSKNTIKYSSYKEIFNVLKNNTAIIFFGYPEDNNSRYTIEVLMKVLEDRKNDTTIYYLNIKDDVEKESEDYLELVSILDNYLMVSYEDVVHNNIKIPSIVFIKDGKVLSVEKVTTEYEKEELYSTCEDNIVEMYSSSCDVGGEEPC